MKAIEDQNPKVHTSKDTVPAKLVMAVAVISVVVGVVSVWISSKLLDATRAELGVASDQAEQVTITAPREIGLVDQTLMAQDRFGLRQRDAERARLRSWGWVDENEGTVHLPVEQAMDLWIQRNETPVEESR